jgi:hypothetical protein
VGDGLKLALMLYSASPVAPWILDCVPARSSQDRNVMGSS